MDKWESLLEQNPFVQKKSVEAEVRALRKALVTFVRGRFPTLAELAQQRAYQIDKPDVLNFLIEQISTASDEEWVRQLLRSQQHVIHEGL